MLMVVESGQHESNLYGKENDLCNCLQACQTFFQMTLFYSGKSQIEQIGDLLSIILSINIKLIENEGHMFDNTLHVYEQK